MKPLLFKFALPWIGDVTFPAYFTFLTLGLLFAAILTVREAPKLGLDRDDIIDINLYMTIFGVIGARILHVFVDGHFSDYVNLCVDPARVPAVDALVRHCNTASECGYEYLCDTARHVCHPKRDCFAWAKLWQGGLVYYGGLILATAYAVYYTRKAKIRFLRVADLAAPAILLGLFFGRLGCYLNGCCYGKVTHSFLGVRFPIGSSPWRVQYEAHQIHAGQAMLPVHPTQLYESLGCLLLFGVTYFLVRPWKRQEGQVAGACLLLYAFLRIGVEVLRDDDRGVLLGVISTSQILSAGGIALALWLLFRKDPLTTTQTAS
ncbi:MAG TPA: prolipoprotein diacylglyceryl transferase [Pseudomonadota bacterium]|nr:prolipoprotein diacylglyceryl transferase [Pseudomonadota bacterium]